MKSNNVDFLGQIDDIPSANQNESPEVRKIHINQVKWNPDFIKGTTAKQELYPQVESCSDDESEQHSAARQAQQIMQHESKFELGSDGEDDPEPTSAFRGDTYDNLSSSDEEP